MNFKRKKMNLSLVSSDSSQTSYAWTDFHAGGCVCVCVWCTFVTGVKVGLSVGLQVAGDVGRAQHLSTDATGDFAFVSDHVGAESVFGGKSGGASLQRHVGADEGSVFSGAATQEGQWQRVSNHTYRYLTFKRSFGGMHMFHMAAQMVRPVQIETGLHLRFGKKSCSCGSVRTCSAGSDNETSTDTEKQVSVNGS